MDAKFGEEPVVLSEVQPGIAFPLARKVTLPGTLMELAEMGLDCK